MKVNKPLVISLILTVLLSALYRIMPNRPYGFAPQIAIAIFSGALFVKDKKWAFMMPLLSMFLSDLLYEVLYRNGLSEIQGFYTGQWVNYLLFTGMTVFGFMIRTNKKVAGTLVAALAAPTAYFLLSNFMVWLGGGGLLRPKTFAGLLLSYTDGLPFYKNSVIATLVFSAILFGCYYLVKNKTAKQQIA